MKKCKLVEAPTLANENIKTNTIGSLNILEESLLVDELDFVLAISTDKAASTENILGISKYITERMTAAAQIGKAKSVRFGNVLGSRASVLNTFKIQLAGIELVKKKFLRTQLKKPRNPN